MASEKCIEWGASGISETAHPRPKAFLASRSDLVLRAQMSLFSVGESRWTTTADCGVDKTLKSHFSFSDWQPHQCQIRCVTSTRQKAAQNGASSDWRRLPHAGLGTGHATSGMVAVATASATSPKHCPRNAPVSLR
jgi:hypothetical protein